MINTASHKQPARMKYSHYSTYRLVSYRTDGKNLVTTVGLQLSTLPLDTEFRFEFTVLAESDQRILADHRDHFWQTADVLLLDAEDIWHYSGEDVPDQVYLLCIQWTRRHGAAAEVMEILVEGSGYHELMHEFVDSNLL